MFLCIDYNLLLKLQCWIPIAKAIESLAVVSALFV